MEVIESCLGFVNELMGFLDEELFDRSPEVVETRGMLWLRKVNCS
jgi:hypothetical protein